MFSWFRRKTKINAQKLATVQVYLPFDRTDYAQIEGFSDDGSRLGNWIGLAKADPTAAILAKNPECNWRQRFGETPTGEYELAEVRKPKTAEENKALGSGQYMILYPISGNAAIAEANGRTTLLIHGGKARPTDGSIRMPDQALAELIALLPNKSIRVIVSETANVNQDQNYQVAQHYDWKYQDSDDSSDLFNYYCQYYAWNSLLNTDHSYPTSGASAFDISQLATAGVTPLPDDPITSNPSLQQNTSSDFNIQTPIPDVINNTNSLQLETPFCQITHQ